MDGARDCPRADPVLGREAPVLLDAEPEVGGLHEFVVSASAGSGAAAPFGS